MTETIDGLATSSGDSLGFEPPPDTDIGFRPGEVTIGIDLTSFATAVLQPPELASSAALLITGTAMSDIGFAAIPQPGAREASIVAEAERRLEQIRADIQWELDEPRFFEDVDAQQPVSEHAIASALELVRSYALQGFIAPRRVSIFPMANGGLQIQSMTTDSAVSIEISPDPNVPILAEFASDDEYHSREVRNPRDAVMFFAHAAR